MNNRGNTPLSDAVNAGQLATMRLLLAGGADVRRRPTKDTVLHLACAYDDVEVAKLLMQLLYRRRRDAPDASGQVSKSR